MKALVDNDILYKGSGYRLIDALINEARPEVGVLGAARFIIPKKIRKARLRSEGDALTAFEGFIRDAVVVEPTDDEQELAAALELLAQRHGLAFDTGESQLSAALLCRDVPLFLTGDKRAIAGLEKLLDLESKLALVQGRVRCLEQLVRLLLDRGEYMDVRASVCAEPTVDGALSLCFSCSNQAHSIESALEGLQSHIAHVRNSAPRVLSASP
jgi:hypothetical protein